MIKPPSWFPAPISDPATAPQHQSLRLCRGTAIIFLQLLEGFLHHDAGPEEDRISGI